MGATTSGALVTSRRPSTLRPDAGSGHVARGPNRGAQTRNPPSSTVVRVAQWPATFRVEPLGSTIVRDLVMYVMVVINVLSTIGMVAGILMHSGKGGGLSDMFGGGGGAALGSAAAERNLNRITFVFVLVWVVSILSLGFLLVR